MKPALSNIEHFKSRLTDFAKDLDALGALLKVDVPSSLNKIRFITEKALCNLCKKHEVSWGNAEPTLERMIGPLVAAERIPKAVALHVRTVQTYTSPGSHFQESELTRQHVAMAQNALFQFLNWYCRETGAMAAMGGRIKTQGTGAKGQGPGTGAEGSGAAPTGAAPAIDVELVAAPSGRANGGGHVGVRPRSGRRALWFWAIGVCCLAGLGAVAAPRIMSWGQNRIWPDEPKAPERGPLDGPGKGPTSTDTEKPAKSAPLPVPLDCTKGVDAVSAQAAQKAWADAKGTPVFLETFLDDAKTVPMTLAFIPAGEFLMGSSDEQIRQYLDLKKKKSLPYDYFDHVDAEKPRHKVRISKPFYLGTTEVTYGQFARFAADKKAQGVPALGKGPGGQGIEPGKEQPTRKPEYNWKNPGFTQGNEQPVCNLTWKDAEAFCDWLSKKEGKRYRLPTEAEWEYACRAGTTTAWNFGNEFKITDRPWSFFPVQPGNERGLTTHTVAKRPGNDFGLFDMHGNVAEMCSDYWDPYYYAACAKDAVTIDPQGPKAAPKTARVIRGGSFLDSIQAARSAYRNSADPTLGYVTIGFRVVCDATEPPPD